MLGVVGKFTGVIIRPSTKIDSGNLAGRKGTHYYLFVPLS